MYLNDFNLRQIQLKTLSKDINHISSINSNINLFKIIGLKNSLILESLLLLELLAGSKSYINNIKKNYKEYNLQISNNLRSNDLIYFLKILKLFYFPILHRRNIKIKSKRFSNNFLSYLIENINFLPFIPNIFFKWSIPINYSINFNTKRKLKSKLFLLYLGFPISINK